MSNYKDKILINSSLKEKHVVSPGIEPGSWVPETHVVSILLRDQLMGQR